MKLKTIGITSGYFNPLHYGHIEYLYHSKILCDFLIVIVNNDFQVKLKKTVPFMDEVHRCKIVSHIRHVNGVFLSIDNDLTVCKSLAALRDDFPVYKMKFFNAGDRQKDTVNTKETELCKKLNIKSVILQLPKLYSSSELIKNKI